MVLEANTQSPVSAVAKLALLVDQNWWTCRPDHEARVLEFLGVVKAVGNEEQAIKIRVARLLAWAKSRDLQDAGSPGWTAFVKEHSPWGASRTRDYMRLVESELDVIKEAVSNNAIALTVATRAPRALGDAASREAQIQWICEAKLELQPERHRAFMDVLSGDDMRCVRKARELGAILLGGDAPVPVIDGFLVESHAQTLTCDQILERARATPPKPERLGKAVPDWKDDPSESLLGPFELPASPSGNASVEPTDIQDCVVKLRALEAFLARRRVRLGMAYWLIKYHYLWTSVPGSSTLARTSRGLLARTSHLRAVAPG